MKLPPSTVEMYDKAVEFWMLLRKELEKAASACGNSGICKAERCKDGHACSPVRETGPLQRLLKYNHNLSNQLFLFYEFRHLYLGRSFLVEFFLQNRTTLECCGHFFGVSFDHSTENRFSSLLRITTVEVGSCS